MFIRSKLQSLYVNFLNQVFVTRHVGIEIEKIVYAEEILKVQRYPIFLPILGMFLHKTKSLT